MIKNPLKTEKALKTQDSKIKYAKITQWLSDRTSTIFFFQKTIPVFIQIPKQL